MVSFIQIFAACTNLTSILTRLFDHNKAVTTFQDAFNGCTGINSTTDLPDWWNTSKYPATTHPQFHLTDTDAVRMFTGCTNAKNYSSVPMSPLMWK
jgi:hypothetical protein